MIYSSVDAKQVDDVSQLLFLCSSADDILVVDVKLSPLVADE